MTFPELLKQAVDAAPSYYGVPSAIEEFEAFDDAEEVENEITDIGRWDIYHRAVYKHDGRYWAVSYREPATENQEWDTDWYEVEEVFPVMVHVTKYMTGKEVEKDHSTYGGAI